MNLSSKLDSMLRIFIWHAYHPTHHCSEYNRGPSRESRTQHKSRWYRKGMRGYQHDVDSSRHWSELGSHLCFSKERLSSHQMIPKTGKVGNTQGKLFWRSISLLSVTAGLLLFSYYSIWGTRITLFWLLKFWNFQKRFKRNDQTELICSCWCTWEGPLSSADFKMRRLRDLYVSWKLRKQ